MISKDSPAARPEASATPGRLRIVSRLCDLSAQLRVWLTERASDRGACVTAALFVLFSRPTCLLLAALVPPGEIAGEPTHSLRADSLLYGQILGQRRQRLCRFHSIHSGSRSVQVESCSSGPLLRYGRGGYGGLALPDGVDLLFAIEHTNWSGGRIPHSDLK